MKANSGSKISLRRRFDSTHPRTHTSEIATHVALCRGFKSICHTGKAQCSTISTRSTEGQKTLAVSSNQTRGKGTVAVNCCPRRGVVVAVEGADKPWV